jgi:hypothetical protein
MECIHEVQLSAMVDDSRPTNGTRRAELGRQTTPGLINEVVESRALLAE